MNKQLLPAKEIRAMFGGVSGMTLWRWLHDESLGFPKPTVIRNRRYWDAAAVEAFRQRTINSALSKSAA